MTWKIVSVKASPGFLRLKNRTKLKSNFFFSIFWICFFSMSQMQKKLQILKGKKILIFLKNEKIIRLGFAKNLTVIPCMRLLPSVYKFIMIERYFLFFESCIAISISSLIILIFIHASFTQATPGQKTDWLSKQQKDSSYRKFVPL